tara:strand:+ start:217 stop:1584 length:1368 start_codon:yes stop_codon:yes gene_type:complete
MADLEKNLSEAIEEVLDEAQQPDSKADKGDQKPVKQGSSDAEKIEGGKGEVVKPEENPVDKAVDSVKSASNVKGVSNDPQQKGASKAEPQPKLKKVSEEEDSEESKPSKMEMIKAMVNAMKGMDKESLQAMYSKMSEDDDESVDESLSKAEIARSIVELMKKKDEEEVEEGYKKINAMMKKEEEEDEEEDEKDKKEVEESAEVESDLVEMEVEDDLEKISEALELSEENQEKARTIFKAAVSSKVEEIKEQLSKENEESLKSSIEQVKGDLSEAVDKYLSYVAEEWSKENELAIERGLRSEMTDNFIDGLKTLFVEHYVEVPEDKYNVMDELANRLDEMEDKLDSEVSKNMELSEELDSMKRDSVVREACKDLSESQQEKLVSLAKGVDFTSTEDFSEKVSELKEAYFPADSETIAEETVVEEGTGDFSSDSEEKVLAPEISQYMTAISKLKPLG